MPSCISQLKMYCGLTFPFPTPGATLKLVGVLTEAERVVKVETLKMSLNLERGSNLNVRHTRGIPGVTFKWLEKGMVSLSPLPHVV